MKDDPRIERLIAMAERLIVALESDIAALKAGTPAAHGQPSIPKSRNSPPSMAAKRRISTSASPKRRRRRCASASVAITAKFREVLQLHARMLTRVKNASEGMIQAIAREVERINAPTRTYGPRPGYRPQSSGRDGLQQSRLSSPTSYAPGQPHGAIRALVRC